MQSAQPGETWYRRILLLFAAVAALGLMCNFAMLLWAQNEFSAAESVVGTQALMLARQGTLYYDIHHYPYTICAYMPLYYFLEAGFHRLGFETVTAGRLISFAALLGIIILVWRLLILYTRDRWCAHIGALLAASAAVLSFWGTTGQVDTLAVFLAVLGFYQYSRHAVEGRRTLLWAGLFAGLAIFTKQTTLACPTAIFILLWRENRKRALQFAIAFGTVLLSAVLLINTLQHGRFLSNTVLANLNPMALEKFNQHLQYLLVASGALILIVALAGRRLWHSPTRAPLVYLAAALTVLALTASKIGSDLNYQIESTILLIVCASLALHQLDFFQLSFRGSRSWVTLLQIPLGIYLVMNFRLTGNSLLTRYATELQLRTQIAALRPYLSDNGRLVSADYNATLHLHGYIDVETFVYEMLVNAGAVNPEPLRRDLASQAFSTILLFQNLETGRYDLGPEITRLPTAQMDEIRKHYKLVAHIPGPYVDGIYVYKPAP